MQKALSWPGASIATRRRPPRARLRLSLTPPLSHEGIHEPHPDAATLSRPEQEPRLVGRDRKTTKIRSIDDMERPIKESQRPHDLVPDASPGRDPMVIKNRAPGIRTLIFERSPEIDSRLDLATPEFVPGVLYRHRF
ncbi:hypothetical protein RRG08_018940 [Elysia crispata]|uniref:Uncharacterized protein n=1 Tax=Elysia crispata TaxID=231223 RepID=A0AAE1A4U4_9GAST|nr:hypothetical protein RRG08_018940 [Elysia crispata]